MVYYKEYIYCNPTVIPKHNDKLNIFNIFELFFTSIVVILISNFIKFTYLKGNQY